MRTDGKDVLSALVGSPLEEVTDELRWDYVRPQLTSADLTSFEQAVQTVLGAVDPAHGATDRGPFASRNPRQRLEDRKA
jgi:hypothetical protein